MPSPASAAPEQNKKVETFAYRIDGNGHRRTLPAVSSDKELLMIGDSVTFGVGVNDAETAASQLQASLGDSYRVINTGVGGYTGQQAYTVADQLSNQQH